MIAAAAIVVFQALSCAGWGALLLAALGLGRRLSPAERLCWAFSAGLGMLGWLVFWPGIAGHLAAPVLLGLLAAGLAGLPLLRPWGVLRLSRPGLTAIVLMVLIVIHAAMDGIEALSPPVDADSLAYHFDLPRRFVEAGAIFFVPRAVDGAVPLLVQMTYVPAYAVGGGASLGPWAVLTCWAGAVFLAVWARRWLPGVWPLVLALLYLGAPAVIYGGGTGQVETRLALFVLLSLAALGRWWREDDWRWLILAGFAAGWFMAGKYTGMLFVAAVGLAVLLRHRRFLPLVVFGAAAMAMGTQWYVWNYVHSGDPVFPMLFKVLGPERVHFWNAEADALFRQVFLGVETPLPITPWTLLSYPFQALLAPLPEFEAGRTGLGIVALLLAPFALSAAWQRRSGLWGSPLMAVLLTLGGFYVLWFTLGGSQRVRHLVPVLPVTLLLSLAAAHAWATTSPRRRLLLAGLAAVLLAQAAGGAVAARWYVRMWGVGPEKYYGTTLGPYPVAAWANANLGKGEKLLNPYREINYLLDVPFYHDHPVDQALVMRYPPHFDPARFWREIRAQGITHVTITPRLDDPPAARRADPGQPENFPWRHARFLADRGCLRKVVELTGRQQQSRSTGGAVAVTEFDIAELTPSTCELEARR